MDVMTTTRTTRPDPGQDDAHELIPPWLENELPSLYATDGDPDPLVRAKFFTPDSSWTWYCIEYSPLERRAFGLVSGHDKELGYFTIPELEQVRGPYGLQVERDLWFTARPLSEVDHVV
jgi:DUF2958 family protein